VFDDPKCLANTRHYEGGQGNQELYSGAGIYISCVELHTILTKAMGKPQELLGQLVNYFFEDQTLAMSVPLQGSRSEDKYVLDPKIVHALIGQFYLFLCYFKNW